MKMQIIPMLRCWKSTPLVTPPQMWHSKYDTIRLAAITVWETIGMDYSYTSHTILKAFAIMAQTPWKVRTWGCDDKT